MATLDDDSLEEDSADDDELASELDEELST